MALSGVHLGKKIWNSKNILTWGQRVKLDFQPFQEDTNVMIWEILEALGKEDTEGRQPLGGKAVIEHLLMRREFSAGFSTNSNLTSYL